LGGEASTKQLGNTLAGRQFQPFGHIVLVIAGTAQEGTRNATLQTPDNLNRFYVITHGHRRLPYKSAFQTILVWILLHHALS
jgi:hypothetical protein